MNNLEQRDEDDDDEQEQSQTVTIWSRFGLVASNYVECIYYYDKNM